MSLNKSNQREINKRIIMTHHDMEIRFKKENRKELHIHWPKFSKACRVNFFRNEDVEKWFVFIHTKVPSFTKEVIEENGQKIIILKFLNATKPYTFWRELFFNDVKLPNEFFEIQTIRMDIHEKTFKIKLIKENNNEFEIVFNVIPELNVRQSKLYFQTISKSLIWKEKNFSLDNSCNLVRSNQRSEISFNGELIYKQWKQEMLCDCLREHLFCLIVNYFYFNSKYKSNYLHRFNVNFCNLFITFIL